MQTLEDLRAGRLEGIKQLTLSENLTTFPLEILTLADSLEMLDLSNNQLSELPSEIAQLKKLKIAFFSYNKFTHFPSALKECKNLYMLGFKANQIEYFAEDILPLDLSWLIITDNRLTSLPRSLGKLHKLQKFTTAGNKLTSLPEEMAACHKLELLRISANELTHIPNWLAKLPKLSWLAFSGNPCSLATSYELPELHYESLEIQELLGQGASGEIFKAHAPTLGHDVAVKLFKGAVTSDGYAKDEMQAYASTGNHPNLIRVLAKIKDAKALGLILELIPSSYVNLGFPPNFETCTRDTFAEDSHFDIEDLYEIIRSIVSASAHIHAQGLMHGDLYAHNILIDQNNSHVYLGDFGAASFYDKQKIDFEKIEVRALGCLIDDLLPYCQQENTAHFKTLQSVVQACMQEDVELRPSFGEIIL